MKDVARVAGVSPSTAARVLHGNGYVSEANREAVIKAVDDLNYRPNLQARSLRNARSYTLGVVLTSARHNPFFAKLSLAIRTAATKAGYSILSFNHDFSEKAESEGIQRLLDHRVETAVFCHGFSPDNLCRLAEAGIPIIQIERSLLAGTHFIAIDPTPGLARALDELVAAGHRRIAFIGWRDAGDTRDRNSAPIELERADTFRRLASERGLQTGCCPVVLGDYLLPNDDKRLPGYDLAEQLLAAPPVPTAIVTGSDVLAAGVLQALYDRRLRVPDDISLIGYDDSIAHMLAPPLTSIAQPYAAIAETVIDIARAARTATRPIERRVTTTLIARRSIDAAPSAG